MNFSLLLYHTLLLILIIFSAKRWEEISEEARQARKIVQIINSQGIIQIQIPSERRLLEYCSSDTLHHTLLLISRIAKHCFNRLFMFNIIKLSHFMNEAGHTPVQESEYVQRWKCGRGFCTVFKSSFCCRASWKRQRQCHDDLERCADFHLRTRYQRKQGRAHPKAVGKSIPWNHLLPFLWGFRHP